MTIVLYEIKMLNGEIVFTTTDKQHADEIVKNHTNLYVVEEEIEINNADEECDI